MHHTPFLCLAVIMTLLWAGATPLAAQEENKSQEIKALQEKIDRLAKALEAMKKESDARCESLEKEIQRLQEQLSAGKDTGEADDDLDALLDDLGLEEDEGELDALLGDLSEEEPSLSQSAGKAYQSMNPNISAIGDFIGHYTTSEGGDLDDEFRFRELELGFSASVDPYARADFFVAFGQEPDGEWDTGLEEGYATFLTMPYDLQPRLGKFRSTFGKANPQHLHALPWVELPLVLENYFGDEGLSGTGAGVNWLVPNPWDAFMELTYEITNNDNDVLFAGDRSDDFMHLVHMKNFFDLSEASTLEAGMSFATAPNDEKHGSDRAFVEGVDLTYKWRPPRSGLYTSFLWQTEVMAAQTDLASGREDSWGMYSAVDYQFARRWTTGARYDHSKLPHDSRRHENGYSLFCTFIQSEFIFWRLAYRFTDRNFHVNGDREEHEVFLQCNFGIGPHRAHKY